MRIVRLILSSAAIWIFLFITVASPQSLPAAEKTASMPDAPTPQSPAGQSQNPAQNTSSHKEQQRQEQSQEKNKDLHQSQTAATRQAVSTPVPRNPLLPNYTHGRSYFPNPLAPYLPREVPPAFLGNTPRIDQIFQNGKIMLSLADAIALTLENNLDIAIARYNLTISDTDILRAKSGQATRGVATGLVQGTPGGGVGGFGTGAQGGGAGGTSTAAGGAGTGTSGLVQSTLGVGPAVESFDPFVIGTLQLEHAVFPESSNFLTGVRTLNQNSATGNFSYNQGFVTGTSLQVLFDNSRQISNNTRSLLQPTINSSFRFTLQQHLLNGLGIASQRRFITIAKNDRRITEAAFRQQVQTTVSQIQNIYWDLVSAYEDVNAKQRALALASKTLSDNKKQVEIGTLAPIEIVRAQSVVATRQQDLIVSQTNLQLQQSLMKNAITRDLPQNSPLFDAEVIPTDTMQLPSGEPAPPLNDLLQQALTNRPELEQSDIDLNNRQITVKAARNALLPTVDLFGFYGASGLAGNPTAALLCGSPSAPPPPNCQFNTGFNNSFARLFDSSAPDKGAGIALTIPIRNRAAEADHVRSELEYRQAELRLQQLKNQIGIEVRNAEYALEQNKARVAAAQEGERLAQQSLDAEQKKYALGASTTTLVLGAQNDLSTSESNLVAAQGAYEKSRVELDRVTGETLKHNNIELTDTEADVIKQMPVTPNVFPRQQAPEQPQPQIQMPPPPSPPPSPQN